MTAAPASRQARRDAPAQGPGRPVEAAAADFDKVWDDAIADYLSSGGQAIMDERAEKWAEYFGDADMLP